MVLLERLHCLEHLDYLISHRIYGSPGDIAGRIGVSRSTLYEYLQVFRHYGANITYNRHNQHFYYEEENSLRLTFDKNQEKDTKNSK